MDLLKQFQAEQRQLSELRSLFEFAPPATLRRSIEDLYFQHVTTGPDIAIPRQVNEHVYLLINFLNEMEGLKS